MPQDPNTPQDPRAETSKETPAPAPQPAPASETAPLMPKPLTAAAEPAPKAPIDLGKILLPKKEVPGQTPESAQRMNAGALLEQETHAAEEGLPKPTPEAPVGPPAAPPKEENPFVAPLETYKGDIERVVQEKNISMVTIAAAEAARRGSAQEEAQPLSAPKESVFTLRNIVFVSLGAIFLVAASGALAYIIYRAQPAPTQTQNLPLSSALIPTDGTQTVVMAPGDSRATLMTNLEAAREQTALSLGLISELFVGTPTTTPQNGSTLERVDPQTLLLTLAPDVPQTLLRSLEPHYLLGVHVYDGNQALLIFKVNSYEEAYAAMLAWEPELPQDLAPLFNYTPRPHIPEEGLATSTPTLGPQITGQTQFVDRIVENHDARVIQNAYGDISLLWTFLDKNTLVITTNDATLREIISRAGTPLLPQPGQ